MAKDPMNNALASMDKDDALLSATANAVENADSAPDMLAKMMIDEAPLDEDTLAEFIKLERLAIERLEEKEAALSERLAQAHEAGLEEQVETYRALLLKVVMAKRQKKADLKEAENKLLTIQLDKFAAEMEKDLTDPLDKDGVNKLDNLYTEKYKRLRAKAKRYNTFAKVFAFIGVIACVIGALAYLILTQPEIYGIPFRWMDLAIDGAALILVVIIASCIKGKATSIDNRADEMEENLPVDMFALDREQLDAISEAYALETAENEPKDKKKKFAGITLPKLPEKYKKKIDKVQTTVKKNADKIIPAAAVGAAVVTTMCISSKKKKAAQKRRAAEARKDFFNWLS